MDEPKSTSSRSLRAWGAGLLLMCLLALVLGVFGAVYFQHNQPASPQVASNQAPPAAAAGPVAPAPLAAAPSTATPTPENPLATQAVQSPESPAPTASSPTASASPPSAQALAQISPTAAPADVAAAAPRYWVEFGAYTGAFYADRLKQSLGSLGIPATVTTAPGAQGRRYLRVRSADLGDHAAALAALTKAQTALRIAPLLHRVAAVSPMATRAARAPTGGRHWVQFGAFRARGGADKVLANLRKNGIQASVFKVKNKSDQPLYLVRAAGLSDRAQATEIAAQGAAALHSQDVLIGESLAVHAAPPTKALPQAPPPR